MPYIAVSLAKAAILFAIIPISILVLQTYKIKVELEVLFFKTAFLWKMGFQKFHHTFAVVIGGIFSVVKADHQWIISIKYLVKIWSGYWNTA